MAEYPDALYRKSADVVTMSPDQIVEIMSGNLLPAHDLNKLKVRPPETVIGLGRVSLRLGETIIGPLDAYQRFAAHAFLIGVNCSVNPHYLSEITNGTILQDIKDQTIKLTASKLRLKINKAADKEVIYVNNRSQILQRTFITRAVELVQAEYSTNEGYEALSDEEKLAFFQQTRKLLQAGWPDNRPRKT